MSADNFAVGLTGTLLVQATGTPIPATAFTCQISNCTAVANAFTLPAGPILGRTYEIRNDGTSYAQIFPAVGAQISNYGANVPAFIGAGGGVLKLIAQTSTQWYVLSYSGPAPIIAAADAAATLGLNYSGCVVELPGNGAARIINLPQVAPTGFNVRFVASAAAPTGDWVVRSAAANINGYLIGAATRAACAAATTITCAHANILVGDILEMFADGTSYNVRGFGQTAAVFAAA